MRAIALLLLLLFLSPTFADVPKSITVYTYDSVASKGSLGPFLKDHIQKTLGVTTEFVAFGSAGEALNQVALEGARTRADLVLGIDAVLAAHAKELGHFEPLESKVWETLEPGVSLGGGHLFVPFDFGYLAFVYDSRRTKPPEGLSFRSIATHPALKQKVVLSDPRTSSLGMSFLAWSRRDLPDEKAWETWWRDLSKQWVTLSPGWSGAYGMFLKKEADYVLSYTTSPAYHLEEEKTDAFKALVFPDGNFRQIEGVGLVKHSKKKDLAKRWVEALLSEEVQKHVATLQWMYPARKGVKLPASFAGLPKVAKSLDPDPAEIEKHKKEWLRRWTAAVAQ